MVLDWGMKKEIPVKKINQIWGIDAFTFYALQNSVQSNVYFPRVIIKKMKSTVNNIWMWRQSFLKDEKKMKNRSNLGGFIKKTLLTLYDFLFTS